MKKIILLIPFLFLIGCSSKKEPNFKTVPDWYLVDRINSFEIIDVGEGNTYKEATINALSNITNRLGVKIKNEVEYKSSYSSETKYFNKVNLNKNIHSSSYFLEYSNYELLNKEHLNNKYYVSIKINKEDYSHFLLEKINKNNLEISTKFNNLKESSLFNKLKEYNSIKIEVNQTLDYIEIYKRLSELKNKEIVEIERQIINIKNKIYKEENNKKITVEYKDMGINFKTQFETFLTNNGFTIVRESSIKVILETNKINGVELNSYKHSISFFDKLNNIKTIYIENKTFKKSNELLTISSVFKKELEEKKDKFF